MGLLPGTPGSAKDHLVTDIIRYLSPSEKGHGDPKAISLDLLWAVVTPFNSSQCLRMGAA